MGEHTYCERKKIPINRYLPCATKTKAHDESRPAEQIIWSMLQPATDWLGGSDPCQQTTSRRMMMMIKLLPGTLGAPPRPPHAPGPMVSLVPQLCSDKINEPRGWRPRGPETGRLRARKQKLPKIVILTSIDSQQIASLSHAREQLSSDVIVCQKQRPPPPPPPPHAHASIVPVLPSLLSIGKSGTGSALLPWSQVKLKSFPKLPHSSSEPENVFYTSIFPPPTGSTFLF